MKFQKNAKSIVSLYQGDFYILIEKVSAKV